MNVSPSAERPERRTGCLLAVEEQRHVRVSGGAGRVWLIVFGRRRRMNDGMVVFMPSVPSAMMLVGLIWRARRRGLRSHGPVRWALALIVAAALCYVPALAYGSVRAYGVPFSAMFLLLTKDGRSIPHAGLWSAVAWMGNAAFLLELVRLIERWIRKGEPTDEAPPPARPARGHRGLDVRTRSPRRPSGRLRGRAPSAGLLSRTLCTRPVIG